jgi:L-amino acid N-acyltransferase YncA
VPEFEVRPVRPEDARKMAELLAAVAEERDGIATEPPVDVDARTHEFAESAAGSLVAEADGAIVGMIHVGAGRFGVGELAMLVERGWRGRGVGSALVAAANREGTQQGFAQAQPRCVRPQRRRDCALPQVRLRRGGAACRAVPSLERGAMGLDRDGTPALTSLPQRHRLVSVPKLRSRLVASVV